MEIVLADWVRCMGTDRCFNLAPRIFWCAIILPILLRSPCCNFFASIISDVHQHLTQRRCVQRTLEMPFKLRLFADVRGYDAELVRQARLPY